MAANAASAEQLGCSFCGKAATDVARLVAGPGVYICNECVGLADQIIAEETERNLPSWADKSDDELIAHLVRIAGSYGHVERALRGLVGTLRERGVTWARIGEALGMSRQAAWERFSGEE